jgi:hypothetical protein
MRETKSELSTAAITPNQRSEGCRRADGRLLLVIFEAFLEQKISYRYLSLISITSLRFYARVLLA